MGYLWRNKDEKVDNEKERDVRKKGQQFKDVGKESTHTPGTFHAIPSVVLNRLDKLTSRKPCIHPEAEDKIYPTHVNSLRKAGLAPPVLLTMGYLCRK